MKKQTKKKNGGPRKRREVHYRVAKDEREKAQGKNYGRGKMKARKHKEETVAMRRAREWLERIKGQGGYSNSEEYPPAAKA